MKCECNYEFNFSSEFPETILGKKLIKCIQWVCPVCLTENKEYFPLEQKNKKGKKKVHYDDMDTGDIRSGFGFD